MLTKFQAQGARPARGRRRDEGGFTLIETSAALIILMVAALSIASLFTYAIQYNTGANDRAIACALAQQRMEYLRKSAFDDVVGGSETVYKTGRAFTVVTTICNDATAGCGGSANAKKITVLVTPQGGGPSWARSSVQLVSLRTATSFGPYFQ